jgi:2-C-methyl-D-erythritol 4-phosphate cytidylyltransferase
LKIVALVTADSHGAGETNALSLVRGEPLLTHAVRGLLDSGYVDLVVVATPAGRVGMSEEALATLLESRLRVVAGESVKQALEAIQPSRAGIFLVHDASRAFTPPRVVRSVVDAVRTGAQVAVPVLPMADTVKLVDTASVIIRTQNRELLRTAQTPLGFTSDALRSAVASGEQDLLASADVPVHTVEGHPNAMRLATPFDLTLAEAVLAADRHEESL